jgi:predicted Zn-dependent peptidase
MSRAAVDVPLVRGEIRETLLPSGIRVLTESIAGIRSVAAGVWVQQGAAQDPDDRTGASHLLEHMVFKGTRTRSPHEIALTLERLGGSLDAFTSREHTSFQARVLSEHLPEAMEILGDLVMEPVLRQEDLDLEREVVLEEIATVEDTPDDLVFELHGERMWDGHPYGRSILGSPESVGAIGTSDLRALHEDRYLKGDLVVAAAGFVQHDALVEHVVRRFGEGARHAGQELEAPTPRGPEEDRFVERDCAQTHIVFGVRTPPRAAPERFPLTLLSALFGGGMSSRLFQKVREEMGLAYSVYSYQSFYAVGGASGVYVGTRPEWAERAVDAILGEFKRLSRDGITKSELEEVKSQVKGQVLLSLESTSARLYRLAGFALYDTPRFTLDELLQRIESVTMDEIMEAAARWFDPEGQTILRLGPAS